MEKTDSVSLKKLKKLFKERFNIDLYGYKDVFSRTDGGFTGNDKEYQVEVKCRRINSEEYPTAILNKEKYDVLVDNKALLVYMYNDKGGICKDVTKAFLKETPIYCSHKTDGTSNMQGEDKVELDLNKFKGYEY